MKNLQNGLTAEMPSRRIAQLLQEASSLPGVKIGALENLAHFRDTAHVLYFVHEEGKDGQEQPAGHCACLIVTKSGSLSLELSGSLCQFWGYWERQVPAAFSDLPRILEEIGFFFRQNEPQDKAMYRFRSGESNERLQRTQRSMEKCLQLNAVFGYRLVASEA